MKKKDLIVIGIGVLCMITTLIIGVTYAYWTLSHVQEDVNIVNSTCFNVEFRDQGGIQLDNAYPILNAEGLKLSPYTFTITNTCTTGAQYQIHLETITEGIQKVLSSQYIHIDLQEGNTSVRNTKLLESMKTTKIEATATEAYKLYTGTLRQSESKTYNLRIWIDEDTPAINEVMNASYKGKVTIDFTAAPTEAIYTETILNGADPVLATGLVPVTIEDDGTVKKANIGEEWYNYGQQRWANAVILEDDNDVYTAGQTIPEKNIESYFVWIPRYKYMIFDEGNYTEEGTIDPAKPQVINIIFETKDKEVSTGSSKGEYLTHPAFTSFNVNGIWVGKFETGYKGITSTAEAEQHNEVNIDKIQIKPDVYSWRKIAVGNEFKNGYDYKRELDSHTMKNTEWGAVAYLSHSIYGRCDGDTCEEIRVNNNSAYITGYAATEEPNVGEDATIEGTELLQEGTTTKRYNNSTYGYYASTTGNITGVYDMAGGAWDRVTGYTTEASKVGGDSGILESYPNFFAGEQWKKYYDEYSSVEKTDWNKRILGDATGETGPFQTKEGSTNLYKSSWYYDYANFVLSGSPWFIRGGAENNGVQAGTFTFSYNTGGANREVSFRIVLAP